MRWGMVSTRRMFPGWLSRSLLSFWGLFMIPWMWRWDWMEMKRFRFVKTSQSGLPAFVGQLFSWNIHSSAQFITLWFLSLVLIIRFFSQEKSQIQFQTPIWKTVFFQTMNKLNIVSFWTFFEVVFSFTGLMLYLTVMVVFWNLKSTELWSFVFRAKFSSLVLRTAFSCFRCSFTTAKSQIYY